jgi:hypothetical protein
MLEDREVGAQLARVELSSSRHGHKAYGTPLVRRSRAGA